MGLFDVNEAEAFQGDMNLYFRAFGVLKLYQRLMMRAQYSLIYTRRQILQDTTELGIERAVFSNALLKKNFLIAIYPDGVKRKILEVSILHK
jgi:hypothetical protein